MRFIKAWSYKCALQLSQSMNESHAKRRVYYFGFEVVIGTLVKLVLLLIAAYLLNILIPAIVIITVFSTLRVIAGGYHAETYGKCFTASLILFIAFGFIAQYTYSYWSLMYVSVLASISFLGTLFVIIKWVPADTPNRPITRQEEILKFKKYSIVFLGIWLATQVIFIMNNMSLFAISGSFGLSLEAFMITPLAYRIFSRLG